MCFSHELINLSIKQPLLDRLLTKKWKCSRWWRFYAKNLCVRFQSCHISKGHKHMGDEIPTLSQIQIQIQNKCKYKIQATSTWAKRFQRCRRELKRSKRVEGKLPGHNRHVDPIPNTQLFSNIYIHKYFQWKYFVCIHKYYVCIHKCAANETTPNMTLSK